MSIYWKNTRDVIWGGGHLPPHLNLENSDFCVFAHKMCFFPYFSPPPQEVGQNCSPTPPWKKLNRVPEEHIRESCSLGKSLSIIEWKIEGNIALV